MFIGYSHYKWSFSIAMLIYQRVVHQHQKHRNTETAHPPPRLQQILWITHVAVDIHHSKHLSMKRIA